MTRENKKSHNKNIGIILGIVLAVAVLSYIGYSQFIDDPTLTMVHYKFQNGTARWLDSEMLITHQFKNGTIVEMRVIDLASIVYPEDFVSKTIHLKDGTIDYHYKHFDSIGSKTP